MTFNKIILCSLLLVCVTANETARKVHVCDHDHHKEDSIKNVHTHYEPVNGNRRLAETRQGIRLTVNTDAVTGLTADQSAVLTHVLDTASAKIQSLLKVTPVSGTLKASRSCLGYFSSGDNAGVCSSHSTTLPTCGTVSIPESLLAEGYSDCTSYTDFPTHCSTLPAGPGVSDSDFHLFVTADHTSRCPDSGAGTLAYASTCQRDQNDRPIFGYTNFCPLSLPASLTDTAGIDLLIGTAIHEFFHALGFSSGSYALMRDEDNNPRTPRHAVVPGLPADDYITSYECGGASLTAWIPGDNVLKTDTDSTRGFPCDGGAGAGNCPTVFTLPKVVEMAREYFDCPTLVGPEIENQPTSSCTMMGSHWEQRVLEQEIMSPILTAADLEISGITLAYFESTGWYTPDYTQATPLTKGKDWGYKQGCAFAQDSCLDANLNSVGVDAHFCADVTSTGSSLCTMDLTAKGYCDAQEVSSSPGAGFEYSASGSASFIVSSVVQRDYCPAVLAYSTGSCLSSANQPESGANYFGEVYSANSMCVMGSVQQDMYVPRSNTGAMCVTATCSGTTSVTLTLANGATASCTTAGQTVTFDGYTGSVTCPDPAKACAVTDEAFVPEWARSPSTTPTATPTVSESASVTPTVSESPSATPSISQSPSMTPSVSESSTGSPSNSASVSDTPSTTVTPSTTPSVSDTPSVSSTPAATDSPTISVTPSTTPLPSVDCVVASDPSDWSTCIPTSPCTASTAGIQARVFTIETFPEGAGTACPSQDSLVESRECTVDAADCDTCANGVLDTDNGEVDIDCGGATCGACTAGLTCTDDSTCGDNLTCGSSRTCVASTVSAWVSPYATTTVRLNGVTRVQFVASATAVEVIRQAIAGQLRIATTAVVVLSVSDGSSSSGGRRLQDATDVRVKVAVQVTGTPAETVAGQLTSQSSNVALQALTALASEFPSLTAVDATEETPTVSTTSLVTAPDSDDGSDGVDIFGTTVELPHLLVGAGVLFVALVVMFALAINRKHPTAAQKYGDTTTVEVRTPAGNRQVATVAHGRRGQFSTVSPPERSHRVRPRPGLM